MQRRADHDERVDVCVRRVAEREQPAERESDREHALVAQAQGAMRARDGVDPVGVGRAHERLVRAAVARKQGAHRAHAARRERLGDRPDLVRRAGQPVETQRRVAAVAEIERPRVDGDRRDAAHRRAASSATRTTSRSGAPCLRAARTQSSTSAENVSRPSGSTTTFTAIRP